MGQLLGCLLHGADCAGEQEPTLRDVTTALLAGPIS